MAADGSSQGLISREQHTFQLLGKRDVYRVVGGEIRPQLQHPTKQRLMSVAKQRQIQIVLDRIRRTAGGESERQEASPKGCRDLDVTKRWSVQVGFGRLKDCSNVVSAIRLQEIFD
jgi:hypothetical protein